MLPRGDHAARKPIPISAPDREQRAAEGMQESADRPCPFFKEGRIHGHNALRRGNALKADKQQADRAEVADEDGCNDAARPEINDELGVVNDEFLWVMEYAMVKPPIAIKANHVGRIKL